MAKGDKNKKTKGVDKAAVPELRESNVLSDGSVSFVLESAGVEHEQESEHEQQSNLTTSFTSQVEPIPNNNLPEKNQEIYQLPDLSDIIVKR